MSQHSRQDRDSLLLLAAMRFVDQPETHRIKVRNLSPGGMMAEGAIRSACGERLMVDLRNLGWISGTVAWVAENRFGVVFDREIDCKAVRVTGTGPSPEMFAPRPAVKPSGPVPGAEPGILRRI